MAVVNNINNLPGWWWSLIYSLQSGEPRPVGAQFLFLQTDDIFAKMEAVAAIHWQGETRVTSESEAAIDL